MTCEFNLSTVNTKFKRNMDSGMYYSNDIFVE